MQILFLSLIFAIASRASGVCYCTKAYDSNALRYFRTGCDDVESANECQRANWEVNDMIISLGSLVNRLLDHHLEEGALDDLQVGFIRSLLSYAIEDEKPEGDCANGLATKTKVGGDVCFSPELLEQCAAVRAAIDPYQEALPVKFEAAFFDESQLYDLELSWADRTNELSLVTNGTKVELIDVVKNIIEVVRFRTSLTTANIRCASYTATVDELGSSSALRLSGFILSVATASLISLL